MRRFINSIPGRLVAQALAVAMLLPFFSFLMATRADAQFQSLPTWGVVDFVNKAKTGGSEVGVKAAEAVASELAKSGKYDVIPGETVKRAVESLGLQQPVTQLESLLRLGAELRASSLVTGEVVNYRIINDGGGKRADVLMRVVVKDMASGLNVNGAALTASSSTRAGDVDDMTLLSEALTAGAAQVTREINQRNLPSATVLNTFEKTALINQGTRTGFQEGMELIVVRGAEQVATASVESVEPDSSIVRITKTFKGIQPGDKVRAVWEVPGLKDDWNKNSGGAQIIKPKRHKSSSDFGTLAITAGILGLLLGGGRSSNSSAVSVFNSEAMMFPDASGAPAVRLSWKLDLFHKGKSNQHSWQIWRSDISANPAVSTLGDRTKAWDTSDPRTVTFSLFGGVIGGSTCDNTAPDDDTADVLGVVPGRPYVYEIQQVYKVAGIDLPGGGSTGTGGTTGTTAGTTGTTAGTTGGTTGGGTAGGQQCYFVSPRQMAKGIATPLNRTNQVAPASGATVATDENFTFQSVVNAAFPITVEYALQFSTDETFTVKSKIKTYAKIVRTDIGILAFVPADYRRSPSDTLNARLRSDFGTSTNQIWWRVGARNVADIPGPVPDKSGQRYIFGVARRMLLPTLPPPPP